MYEASRGDMTNVIAFVLFNIFKFLLLTIIAIESYATIIAFQICSQLKMTKIKCRFKIVLTFSLKISR